jgi:PAS domain S-box-containing protein
VELRSYIERALKDKRALHIPEDETPPPTGDFPNLSISITPLFNAGGRRYATIISFTDKTRVHELQLEIQATQEAMETTNEELQSSNEELETTNEELQSTNEELETTNEELQSANEELETTNEELQSTNEELSTANEQLRVRTDELTVQRTITDGAFNGIDIGIAVLDDKLRILEWNRWNENAWGLRREEVLGEPILNLELGLPIEKFRSRLRAIARGKSMAGELVVSATDRRGFPFRSKMKALHLRGAGGPLGLVLVIYDVTAEERVKSFLEDARNYAEAIVDTVREPLLVLDSRLRVVSASKSFYKYFRVAPEETVGKPLSGLGEGQWKVTELLNILGTILPEKTTVENYVVDIEFPRIGRRRLVLNARQVTPAEGLEPMILLAMHGIDAEQADIVSGGTKEGRAKAAHRDKGIGDKRHSPKSSSTGKKA